MELDPESPVPPFEQVKEQIAAAIEAGSLEPADRLPTVRQLATDLGLAANTVARSYRELELAGLLETRGRHGTFVAPTRHRPGSSQPGKPGTSFVPCTNWVSGTKRPSPSSAEKPVVSERRERRDRRERPSRCAGILIRLAGKSVVSFVARVETLRPSSRHRTPDVQWGQPQRPERQPTARASAAARAAARGQSGATVWRPGRAYTI